MGDRWGTFFDFQLTIGAELENNDAVTTPAAMETHNNSKHSEQKHISSSAPGTG
jgi:hypothetical protein